MLSIANDVTAAVKDLKLSYWAAKVAGWTGGGGPGANSAAMVEPRGGGVYRVR